MRLPFISLLTAVALSGCLGALEQTCGAGSECLDRQVCLEGVCVCADDTVDVNGDPTDGCEHRCDPAPLEGPIVFQAAGEVSDLAVAPAVAGWIDEGRPNVWYRDTHFALANTGRYARISVGVLPDGAAVVAAHQTGGAGGLADGNRLWRVDAGGPTEITPRIDTLSGPTPTAMGPASIQTFAGQAWPALMAFAYRTCLAVAPNCEANEGSRVAVLDVSRATPQLVTIIAGDRFDLTHPPVIARIGDSPWVFAVTQGDGGDWIAMHAVTEQSVTAIGLVAVNGDVESHYSAASTYLVNVVGQTPRFLGQNDVSELVLQRGHVDLSAYTLQPVRFPLGGGALFTVRGQPVGFASLAGQDGESAILPDLFKGQVERLAGSTHDEVGPGGRAVPVWAAWVDAERYIKLAQMPCQ